MDDNAVGALEEQLERVAATDREALARPEKQHLVLQVLNVLGASLRELAIERRFGSPDGVHVARKFGIDQRLDLLKVRYARIVGYLEPESKQWFEALLEMPSGESGPTARAMPGPSIGERPPPTVRGVNVARLIPLQVRISEPQALALEQAKKQTGRSVSQLLRDALTLARIDERRQWRRTDSDGQLAIKRWVRCDAATMRALQLVALREHLTLSNVVRELLDDALGV